MVNLNAFIRQSMILNANGPIMAGSEHEDDVEISMEMKQLLEENQELKSKHCRVEAAVLSSEMC